MPWKHVVSPAKRYVTNKPATTLDPQESPFISGMILKDGEARSDFGMVNFPVAGALKTNALNGVVMKVPTFELLNGTSYLLALTTTHLYQYNTSTKTWDVATQGTEIDDCEAAWDAQANVTSTADTAVKLRDSKSAKHVIAAGFTTGIISSEDDLQNVDISAAKHTHLVFWARADAAVASGVLALRLSEQAAGATGATYADYNLSALVADEWQHISLEIASPDDDNGGTYPDDLNALASVALIANSDPGAVTVYIDDVRAVKGFTGDEDNRWSVATLNDKMGLTNGVDNPSVLTESGGLVHTDMTLTLASGALTTCEIMIAFKDHMLYFNNTENGGDAPQRCSWSNIGDIEDMVAGTAGFQDLLDDASWVMGALMLSENEIAVYKEDSILQCTWIGGHTPFRFKTIVAGTGAMNKDCIVNTPKGHAVLGTEDAFIYTGNRTLQPISQAIKKTIYARIDGAYTARAFMLPVKADDEVQIWVPVEKTTPDEGYTWNRVDDAWYLKDRNISGYGFYQEQSSLTIGELVGTIGEQDWTFGSQLTKQYFPITLVGDANGKVYKLDKATLDNAGTAIVNEIQTPDFVLPGIPEYMNKDMYISMFIFEAKGQSITTTYSTDGGNTWAPTQGAGTNVTALTSIYKDYQQFFDADAKMIRFKFYNEAAASGFHIRHFAYYWILRTGRR